MENVSNEKNFSKPLLGRFLNKAKGWNVVRGRLSFWLRNKYIIAVGLFTGIMLFFDKNDIFTQANRKNQLKDIQQSKQYYTDRIATERKELELLKTNPATLEKYAREKYLMKRDKEDLYLIPENKTEDNR